MTAAGGPEGSGNGKEFVKKITTQEEDFSRWYLDVIRHAELMDYSPVRGCIVFRPDGYELWERIQQGLDRRFKATGHRNAYFPLFIPESLFEREKEHVEGFNPELPWVTQVGDEQLEERLAIRPTSETIIGYMYSRWIHSYRDLPVLLNQWANVVRWEKRTLPFLRTSEFLWQEGHTAHATEEEARREALQMLEVYRDFIESEMAVPVIPGVKSASEKFAGAQETYSVEAMMRDGRALQAGTSHYLGTNFAQVFDIKYLDRDNQLKHVHTTSWGVSTRLIGALVMVHGDNRGLRLPPELAPLQVVLIPVGSPVRRGQVLEALTGLEAALSDAGCRVKTDAREEYTPGWKFNEYELRGVPIRLELGPRDLDRGQCVLVRRDTGEKQAVPLAGAVQAVRDRLRDVQANLLHEATAFRERNSFRAESLDELVGIFGERRGFVLAGWCGQEGCEGKVKDVTGATLRNIPFEPPETLPRCAVCGRAAVHTVWYARAY